MLIAALIALASFRPKLLAAVLVAVLMFLGGATEGTRATNAALDSAPSDLVEEARQLVTSGQHTEALQLIAKQLTQARGDNQTNERYQLLMLKGESLLQTGKSSLAAGAFEQAGRVAPDGLAGARARANVLLIKASPGNKYTAKGSASKLIDIVDVESRKLAYHALREDLSKAFKPRMAKAAQSKTLVPAMELLPAVFDLASLEYASSGSTNDTQADVAALGARSREMMQASVRRSQRQIESLEDLSNSDIGLTRRGLQSNEQKDLKQMVMELRKIEKTARDVRRRAQEIGFPGTAWEPIATDAADQAEAAEALLEFGTGTTRG